MEVRVIGGGLAGSEASYQLLKRGYNVKLYEMRKVKQTPCHNTTNLCELVCSNSLKSTELSTASGTLKEELKNPLGDGRTAKKRRSQSTDCRI